MKRTGFAALFLAFCLILYGCGNTLPQKTEDGLSWDDGWVTVGTFLGADTPDDLTPRENNDALAGNGMYYATWSLGDGQPYENAEGNEATVYDAQVYMLLAEGDSPDEAAAFSEEWLSMAQAQYSVHTTAQEICAGQAFTILCYGFSGAGNPYKTGVSAFGHHGNYAMSVELSCGEDFTGNARELLLDFLNHCHYAA